MTYPHKFSKKNFPRILIIQEVIMLKALMNVGINLIANGVGIASDQIINLGALFALAGSPTCPRLTVTSF